jgi:3'-5' exoribonuclease
MKSPYVNELQPNQVITATFLVHIKDIRQKKTGEPYLSLLLGDRTGELEAKMWDNVTDVLESFSRDDFVKVKGLLQIYQNRPQLTVHKMMRILDSDVDFSDYFPSSERDPDEMFAELRGIVEAIQNPHLRQLLDCFLNDETIARLYRIAPAAKSVHHAFLGGLLEHVLSLCHLCKMTSQHYRIVDLDLLLTGAILHDVGKIEELTYDRSFGYSAEGQLLGHIVIGLRMVNERLQRFPDFPPRLRTMVEHMIVSHHGELEFGSPKVPLFPEALLLHHLDNLDSKMECMRATIAKDRHADGCWTSYNPSLERAVLKKLKYLDEQGTPVMAAAAVVETTPLPQPVPAASEPPPVSVVTPLPAEPAPAPPRLERSMSLFGEKLQQVWKK